MWQGPRSGGRWGRTALYVKPRCSSRTVRAWRPVDSNRQGDGTVKGWSRVPQTF